MYFRCITLIYLSIAFINLGETLLCWSCSNNPHDFGKNPCPDEITNFGTIQTEYCLRGNCFLKMAKRDKGILRPIKSGCIRTNKTQNGLPDAKCQSGVGLEMSNEKLSKHFTSKFCTIRCDTDLCDYRIAKKIL